MWERDATAWGGNGEVVVGSWREVEVGGGVGMFRNERERRDAERMMENTECRE